MKLTPEQKRFITLHVMEGMSLDRVSKEMNISKEKLLDWNSTLDNEISRMKREADKVRQEGEIRRKSEKDDLAILEEELNMIDISKYSK